MHEHRPRTGQVPRRLEAELLTTTQRDSPPCGMPCSPAIARSGSPCNRKLNPERTQQGKPKEKAETPRVT